MSRRLLVSWLEQLDLLERLIDQQFTPRHFAVLYFFKNRHFVGKVVERLVEYGHFDLAQVVERRQVELALVPLDVLWAHVLSKIVVICKVFGFLGRLNIKVLGRHETFEPLTGPIFVHFLVDEVHIGVHECVQSVVLLSILMQFLQHE